MWFKEIVDGRTDDGQWAITKAHIEHFVHRWAKKFTHTARRTWHDDGRLKYGLSRKMHGQVGQTSEAVLWAIYLPQSGQPVRKLA